MREAVASRSIAIVAAALLLSCAGADEKVTVVTVPSPVEAPAPPDPRCEAAAADRARVSGLLAEGKLDRAARVLEHAGALCPARARETWAALVTTLVEVGRRDEARRLANLIEATPRG